MKTCPICGSVAFDDQPLCFGCLHDYDAADAPDEDSVPSGMPVIGADARLPSAKAKQVVFKLILEPLGEGATEESSWSCSVVPA